MRTWTIRAIAWSGCLRISISRYSYFERWLHGLTTTLLAGGLITPEESPNRQGRARASAPRTDATDPDSIDPYSHPGYRHDIDAEPRFKPGDRVRTANPHPAGHTRLPRYARDKVGHIHLHHGAHVLPDAHAHGKGEAPTHLYTVVLQARDLWGPEAGEGQSCFSISGSATSRS